MAAQYVTIKDVARHAGVAVSTASRALSGTGATSPSTQERVRRAAAELHYRTNMQARSLRAQNTQTIGLLIPDVRNTYFAELAYSIEQRALGRGFATLLGNADEQADQQLRYLQTMRSMRVDGIILAPQSPDPETMTELARDQIPVVFVDRDVPAADVPAIVSDPAPGVSAAVQELASGPWRRLGCIAGPQHTSTGRERLAVFRAACQSHDVPLTDDQIHIGDFQTRSGAEGLHRLVDAGVDAILVADSPMTLGALQALHDRGLRAGRDIALIGFDDLDLFALTDPPLTVVTQDVDELARRTLDTLFAVMAGEQPASLRLPTSLVVRESTQAPERSPKAVNHG